MSPEADHQDDSGLIPTTQTNPEEHGLQPDLPARAFYQAADGYYAWPAELRFWAPSSQLSKPVKLEDLTICTAISCPTLGCNAICTWPPEPWTLNIKACLLACSTLSRGLRS